MNRKILGKVQLTYDVEDMRLFKEKYGRLHEFFQERNINDLKVDIEAQETNVKIRLEAESNTKLLRALNLLYEYIPEWYTSIRRGDLEAIEYLLGSYDIDINRPGKDNITPLMIACGHGGIAGGKVVYSQPNGHLVLLLLKHNADKNAQDSYGNTAYSIANDKQLNGIAMLVKPGDDKQSANASNPTSTIESNKNTRKEKYRRHSVGAPMFSMSSIYCDDIENNTSMDIKNSPKPSLPNKNEGRLKAPLKRCATEKVSQSKLNINKLRKSVDSTKPSNNDNNEQAKSTSLQNHSLTALLTLSPRSLGLSQYSSFGTSIDAEDTPKDTKIINDIDSSKSKENHEENSSSSQKFNLTKERCEIEIPNEKNINTKISENNKENISSILTPEIANGETSETKYF